jgi:hypothetical protein
MWPATARPHALRGSRQAGGLTLAAVTIARRPPVHRAVRTVCPHANAVTAQRTAQCHAVRAIGPHPHEPVRRCTGPGQAADGQSADRSRSLQLPLLFLKAALAPAATQRPPGSRPPPSHRAELGRDGEHSWKNAVQQAIRRLGDASSQLDLAVSTWRMRRRSAQAGDVHGVATSRGQDRLSVFQRAESALHRSSAACRHMTLLDLL